MSAAASKPLIAILGSTGVGKSKLAVDLALALSRKLVSSVEPWCGAEVINADSMQTYRGLDVITNKSSEDEMQGVPHHLIGFKDIGERYVVHDWIHDVLPLIDRAHQANHVPFVVGGTAYWIQHLLFPDRLPVSETPSTAGTMTQALGQALDSLSSEQRHLFESLENIVPATTAPPLALSLHGLLTAIDPVTAARWHWKDVRKVLRSLKLVTEQGCLPSEVYEAQSLRNIVPSWKRRYRTLFLWLNASSEVLYPRLERRIEQMLKLGLLDEIQIMRSAANQLPAPIDYTQGIFQAIGYKEFSGYLDDPARPSELFEASMERMRISTRQYAQRQVRWIRNKLLPVLPSVGEAATMVILDASDLDHWDVEVRRRAQDAMQSFLRGDFVGLDASSPSMSHYLQDAQQSRTPIDTLTAMRKTACALCTADPEQPFMLDEAQWKAHISTKLHKRAARRAQNRERVRIYRLTKDEAEASRTASPRDEASSSDEIAGDGAVHVRGGLNADAELALHGDDVVQNV